MPCGLADRAPNLCGRRLTGLDGTLPAAWGDLAQLETMYLDNSEDSSTSLRGTLPTQWSKLSRMSSL